jgi:multisubunit Na+/H+ antiporter MnhG subunit
MKTMAARALAGLLVMVLVGPSVVTATCELTCAMASHHHGTASSSAASCHEHQGSEQGAGISAGRSSPCHGSEALPSAVVTTWLTAVSVSAVPVAVVFITPPITTRAIARAHEHSAPFDPRPAHRPLRV